MKKILTLTTIVKDNKILLGMKKRGFGMGNWNGFGGKVEIGETILEAARREVLEESGLVVGELKQVGLFDFKFADAPVLLEVHVFLTSVFSGTIVESEEMEPRWFDVDKIPFESMWSDDIFWLPRILRGELLCGQFEFDKDNKLTNHQLAEVTDFADVD